MADYTVTSGGRAYLVRLTDEGPAVRATLDGEEVRVRLEPAVGSMYVRAAVGAVTHLAAIRRMGAETIVTLDDEQYRLGVEPAAPIVRRTRRSGTAAAEVRAPIPGLIVSVETAEGDTVEQGRPLVVMEAMKMQSELRAPVGGRVTGVHVQAGQEVMGGAVLVTIVPAGSGP